MKDHSLQRFVAEAKGAFGLEKDPERKKLVIAVVSKQRQASPMRLNDPNGELSRWATLLFLECNLLTKSGRAAEVPRLIEAHLMPDGILAANPRGVVAWAAAKLATGEAQLVYDSLKPQIGPYGLYEGAPYVTLYVGLAALELDKCSEARLLIAPLVQKNGTLYKCPTAQKGYSRLLFKQGAYAEHVRHFGEIRHDKDRRTDWARTSGVFLQEAATALMHEKRLGEASAALRPVLGPNGPHRRTFALHYLFGEILIQSGQAQEAADHLLALVQPGQDFAASCKMKNLCGCALIEAGRYGEAIAILEPIVKDEDYTADKIVSQHLYIKAHACDITRPRKEGTAQPEPQHVVAQLLRISNRLWYLRSLHPCLEKHPEQKVLVRAVATMIADRTKHLAGKGSRAGLAQLRSAYHVRPAEGTSRLTRWTSSVQTCCS